MKRVDRARKRFLPAHRSSPAQPKKGTTAGEGRQAIATLFGAIRPVKHIFVFDEDIDIRNEGHVAWAMGTRFQADEDIVCYMA